MLGWLLWSTWLALSLASNVVQQVHLSFSRDTSEMQVTWITLNPLPEDTIPLAKYGVFPNQLISSVSASTTKWVDGGAKRKVRYTHRATLTHLRPGVRYYYAVGSAEDMSVVFSFLHPDPRTPLRVAIYGDLALSSPFSVQPLISATENGDIDVVVHLGDISYDLDVNDGDRGDTFMQLIQPITSSVPFMTVAGNHEVTFGFQHYINRFTMPFNSVFNDNQFWNVDLGVVHLIGLSTEYYGYQMVSKAKAQFDWVQKLLRENSAKWTIVIMHRPLYCSTRQSQGCNDFENTIMRDSREGYPDLEELFNEEGVDMVFWGHVHLYERYWPIYRGTTFKGPDPDHFHNASTPIYQLTGAGGIDDGDYSPQIQRQPFSAKLLDKFGYSLLTIHNATHITTEFVDARADPPAVVDTFWLTKDGGHRPGIRNH